jgi:hypothetical protein
MNEAHIQTLLFRYLQDKGHSFIAPNCCALGYEADLLSVPDSGFCYEYEIKTTRADFKADAAKRNKHDSYSNAGNMRSLSRARRAPARFYYVVPAHLVEPAEVPVHSGLMFVLENGTIETIKQAPWLHHEMLGFDTYRRIANSLMWKVFNGVTKRQEMVRTR